MTYGEGEFARNFITTYGSNTSWVNGGPVRHFWCQHVSVSGVGIETVACPICGELNEITEELWSGNPVHVQLHTDSHEDVPPDAQENL